MSTTQKNPDGETAATTETKLEAPMTLSADQLESVAAGMFGLIGPIGPTLGLILMPKAVAAVQVTTLPAATTSV